MVYSESPPHIVPQPTPGDDTMETLQLRVLHNKAKANKSKEKFTEIKRENEKLLEKLIDISRGKKVRGMYTNC